MPVLLISSSWVLADTFDAVPQHTQCLDLSDPKLCEYLEFQPFLDLDENGAFVMLEPLPSIDEEEGPELRCEVCFDSGWLELRGCNVWFRKSRMNDPVRYRLFQEHMDVSAMVCPACCGLARAA